MAKLEITDREHRAAKKYQAELKAMGVHMTLKKCYVELAQQQATMKNIRMGRVF